MTLDAYLINGTAYNVTTTIFTTSTVTVGGSMPAGSGEASSMSTAISYPPMPNVLPGQFAFRLANACPSGGNITRQILVYPELYTFNIYCGFAFQNENAYTVETTLTSEDDCYAACAQADSNFGGPLCKGFTWNGSTCNLYTEALYSDLVSDPSSDAAILNDVYPVASSPVNFNMTSGTPDQTTSALSSVTSNFTYTSPPAQLILPGNGTTITFSSCSGSTWTSGPVVEWTSTCSTNSSWYEAITQSATAAYTTVLTEVISISGQGSAANGAGGQAVVTGGFSTIPTVVSGSTVSTVVPITISGAGSSSRSGGGSYALTETLSTVVSNSTIVYVTVISTSGSGGTGFETGGALTLTNSETISYISGVITGGGGAGTASGGSPIILTTSSGFSLWNYTLSGGGSSSFETGGNSPLPTGNAITSSLFTFSIPEGGRSGSQGPPETTSSPFPQTYIGFNLSTSAPSNVSATASPSNSSSTSPFTFSIPGGGRSGSQGPPESSTSAPFFNGTTSSSGPYTVIVTTTVTTSACECSTTDLFSSSVLYSSTSSSSSTPSETASPFQPLYEPRIAGQPATPDQIAAACNYTGNQIYNGGFELTITTQQGLTEPQDYGWITNDATHVQFMDTTEPDQLTPGGSRVAQFAADSSTATGILWQPLTLCPNKSYEFSANARQNFTLDDCTASFTIGDFSLGSLDPGEQWTNTLTNPAIYAVGPDAANASVNLEITMQCSGISYGNYGVLELDQLALVPTGS
jgi:hypothetical protein